MTSAQLLIEGFERIGRIVQRATEGLSAEQLATSIEPEANSIAWLVWHLTRLQDDHVAHVAESEQVWTRRHFAVRFGFDFDVSDVGYGHDALAVAKVTVDSADLLTEYYEAVQAATIRFLQGVDDAALDRIVDERYDPPVTLGVRLVSVLSDNLQHAGQAAFVRGILLRRA